MITIKQMEALHCVARLGGIAAAAQRLHMTESALSKRLQELEAALGVAVFERDSRRLCLLPSAKGILELCEAALDACSAIYKEVDRQEENQVVRIGLTELASSLYLRCIVDAIAASGRDVTIQPMIGLNDHLVRMVRQEQLDIAICPSLPTVPGEFRRKPIGESQSLWLCRPELDVRGQPLSLAELTAMPLILQPENTAFHQAMMAHFERHGLRPARVITCDTLAGLRDFAAAGLGIAPLPLSFCGAQLAAGTLKVLDAVYVAPVSSYAVFSNRVSSKQTIDWLTDVIAGSIVDLSQIAR